MTLQDRLESLEPRERRLVFILFAIFAVMLVLMIPLGVSALLSDEHETRARLTEAIERIETEGDDIRERQAAREALLSRYETPAPALAGFLAKAAAASAVDIPESKDQSPVAHGKRYEERSTSISLRKVGLLSLVKFMERVSGTPDPISITKLNVRKRGGEPDTYDVQLTVAAYHRLQSKAKAEEEQP
jgi:general secretion pathway protein M